LKGEIIFESGPGLRNWITPESADGFGMAVAAWVGGRFRVGRGIKVSVGFVDEIDPVVRLASGSLGKAISEVGELVLGPGSSSTVGMAVSGMRTRVGNSVDAAGTQAVKKKNRHGTRKKRRNIIRLLPCIIA
jgi:hypothetical protein